MPVPDGSLGPVVALGKPFELRLARDQAIEARILSLDRAQRRVFLFLVRWRVPAHQSDHGPGRENADLQPDRIHEHSTPREELGREDRYVKAKGLNLAPSQSL